MPRNYAVFHISSPRNDDWQIFLARKQIVIFPRDRFRKPKQRSHPSNEGKNEKRFSYFEWKRRFRWNRGNENDFRGETNYTRGRFNRVDRDEWKRKTRENRNIFITRWRCNKVRPTRRKFRRGEASRVASLEKRDGEKKKRRMKGISGRGGMIERRGKTGELNTAKEVNSGNFSDGSA